MSIFTILPPFSLNVSVFEKSISEILSNSKIMKKNNEILGKKSSLAII